MDELKGPLHGLPVCIKDDTNVEGMDSTLGYAKNLYKPATDSAVLVKALKDLGAVPFCKTNVPQTLVSFASDNPIFGKTLNCNNPKMAPGGSSSGTGCLVGAGGAPFGTGTDVRHSSLTFIR
jgi:fatty acid amide hydrolase